MKPGIAFLISALLFREAASASQADIFHNTDKLDDKADHDSEDRAVEKGFEAFANLAALNIGGAISNGKQAYGAYQNSREFERIGREAERRKLMMGSTGEKQVRAARERRHILGTMDRSRLYRGAVGDAADKAERAFGWNREQMFDIAVRWEAKVLDKLDGGNSITGAVFGEVVEDARRLIPAVPNAGTRKTLERVSAIVTPKFAEAALDRIVVEHAAGAGTPDRTAPPGAAEGAQVSFTNPAAAAASLVARAEAGAATKEELTRLQAEENLEKALQAADACAAAAISREAMEASGRAIILTGEETQGDARLLDGYFPPERTIFEMIRTQTSKFDRRNHGLPAAQGYAKAESGLGR